MNTKVDIVISNGPEPQPTPDPESPEMEMDGECNSKDICKEKF